jgi:hypothetical protein
MWNEPNGSQFTGGGPIGYWGGANDGLVHWPITSLALGVNNRLYPGAKFTAGTVEFSDATLVPGKVARAAGAAAGKVNSRAQNLALFAAGHPWKFWNGAEFPGAAGSFKLETNNGRAVGILAYNFTGGGNYVDTTTGISLYHPATLRFMVKSARSQQILIRISDHTGQTLQFYRSYSKAGHWQPIEVNVQHHWPSGASAYAKLAVDVGKTIRRVNPRAWYTGPALAGSTDLQFLKTCFQAGTLKYWNAVSVHPYRQGGPETVIPRYAAIRKLIAQYAPPGRHIPLLSGEWGYSSTWYKGNDAQQARYAARELLTNVYQGIRLSIYYDWHDDGRNPKNQEDNFGLVHYAYFPGRNPIYNPKPAYLAVRTLTTQLHDCHFVRRLSVGGGNDYVLRFAGPDGQRIAAWKTGGKPQTVVLPLPAGQYRITNETGTKTRTAAVRGGKLSLRISHDPEYVAPLSPH